MYYQDTGEIKLAGGLLITVCSLSIFLDIGRMVFGKQIQEEDNL